MNKSISKKDFDAFLKYARDDNDRQRETLQSLFAGRRFSTNIDPDDAWSNEARNLCTIQQWAQLRYRVARLEEFSDLLEAKMNYAIRTSDDLLKTVAVPLDESAADD